MVKLYMSVCLCAIQSKKIQISTPLAYYTGRFTSNRIDCAIVMLDVTTIIDHLRITTDAILKRLRILVYMNDGVEITSS